MMVKTKTQADGRLVRIAGKEKTIPAQKAARGPDLLLKTAAQNKQSFAELVASITGEELVLLIDSGATLDAKAKEYNDRMKQIKEILRAHAEANEWRSRTGSVGQVKVGSTSRMTLPPEPTARLLAQLGKRELFKTIFSVRVAEAKKYLGLDDLEPIAETTTKDYDKVSFKLMK